MYDVVLMQEVQAARDRQGHVLPFVVPVKDVSAVLCILEHRFPQVPTLQW